MRRDGFRRWFLIGGAALVIALLIAGTALLTRPSEERVDLTATLTQISMGHATEVKLSSDGRTAEVTFADETTRRVNLPPGQTFTELLTDAGIPASEWPAISLSSDGASSESLTLAIRILSIVAIGAVAVFLLRRFGPGGFGGSNSRRGAFTPVRPGEQPITFADVAGSEEVKQEVGDIVDFLRNPDHYRQLGAHIPRGLLLSGPPGTGKTLLARALAGEANASFFSVSGSEFVELYVGVGASRVRDLFKKAKECSPAIIFIDEIDAIGRRRGRAEQSSEYDQTLNQILVEMDGFEERSTVVVVAATNRSDILDSALTRPGRFDRKVMVDLPDRAARLAILGVHARGKPLAAGVSFDELAARTAGMSGADLSNVINEAAILAVRAKQPEITMANLFEALDRTIAGPARNSGRFTEHERRVIAYHEAGHAVVAHVLPHADVVRKVSIVSRGRAGGFTMIVPEEDRGLWTRRQLNDRLAALLGGMVAEELIFGDITTGSSNDLEQVTSIASSMVQRYGMSQRFGLLSVGNGADNNQFSPQTVFTADQETLDFVTAAHRSAIDVLNRHRDDLERVTARLLEVETIEREELASLVSIPNPAPEQATTPVVTPPIVEPISPVRKRSRNRGRRVGRAVTSLAAIVRSVVVAMSRQGRPQTDRT